MACGGGGGGGGGGKDDAAPAAAVAGAIQTSGAEMLLTISVTDEGSRAVDVLVEYSVDGGASWLPATQRPGEAPPVGVAATPGGTEVAFTWMCWQDLGCGLFPDTRLRVTAVEPPGTPGEYDSFELIAYAVPPAPDLRADIYPDLQADGEIDAFVLVDSRDPGDHASGALPGAISVTLAEILAGGEAALPWPRDTRIVFYCFGGS